MDTIQNIKKVSILFFIIIGTLHIGSTLFISNGFYLKRALIINKTLDIPFIITGLIYGLTSLRISLAQEQKSHTILDTILAGSIIVIFLALITINLLLPDLV